MTPATPAAPSTRRPARRSLFKRATRAVSNAVTRAFLQHCIRNVSAELATMREQLAHAEEVKRTTGPYASNGVALLTGTLRAQVEGLEEELAYLDFCLSALEERDCRCDFIADQSAQLGQPAQDQRAAA